MDQFKIILNSFGLQNLKPKFYGRGTPLQKTDKSYNKQSAPETQRFDTGRDIQRISLLGTPVFSDMILSYGDQELSFDIVLIEVTGRKHIVETVIPGRDGSVKEFITNDDYQVNIKTMLHIMQPDVYPIDDVSKFIKLMKVNDAINIVSPVADLFDIFQIVVKDFRIRQEEAKMNIVPVEITAVGDNHLNIVIE